MKILNLSLFDCILCVNMGFTIISQQNVEGNIAKYLYQINMHWMSLCLKSISIMHLPEIRKQNYEYHLIISFK